MPGDERGFVSRVRDGEGPRIQHNDPGTRLTTPTFPVSIIPPARKAQDVPPMRLTLEQADLLLTQFRETAEYRHWRLLAVAIMANHVHLIVAVDGDPDPSDILGDFKSYGSRALNRQWPKPVSGTWWTESGSKRKLLTEEKVREKIEYVRDQPYPLLVWIAEEAGERGA